MTKVRINDLARELEVKSKPILDALEAIGVTGKTHSSSIEADQAERVRDYFKNGSRSGGSRPAVEAKPKFDLSHVSKPGDALRAILERKSAEAAAKAAPPQRHGLEVDLQVGGDGFVLPPLGCGQNNLTALHHLLGSAVGADPLLQLLTVGFAQNHGCSLSRHGGRIP